MDIENHATAITKVRLQYLFNSGFGQNIKIGTDWKFEQQLKPQMAYYLFIYKIIIYVILFKI